jgi:hypothetical protein
MNQKNLIIIGIALVVSAIGCAQSGNQSRLEGSKSPTSKDSEPKQIIDVKQIIGNSPKQVTQILGQPQGREQLKPKPNFNYDEAFDYSWGMINFRKDRATYIHYESPTGYENFFPLGKEVGIDFFGVEPSSGNDYAFIYRNTTISGIKFSEVRILMSDGKKYRTLTFAID